MSPARFPSTKRLHRSTLRRTPSAASPHEAPEDASPVHEGRRHKNAFVASIAQAAGDIAQATKPHDWLRQGLGTLTHWTQSSRWAQASWRLFAPLPNGGALYGRFLGWMVPYTGTIRPDVIELRPGFARIAMQDRRRTRNHLGSTHAIALANLAELAGNLALVAGLLPEQRFIVRSFSIRYDKKARGRITATCDCVSVLHAMADTSHGLGAGKTSPVDVDQGHLPTHDNARGHDATQRKVPGAGSRESAVPGDVAGTTNPADTRRKGPRTEALLKVQLHDASMTLVAEADMVTLVDLGQAHDLAGA